MFQSNYNQQQTLPFSATQPDSQYPPIQLNNPPFVPSMPGNQELIHFVSALCAAEIQRQALTNPLRIFMYNQCSSNGFRNEDFVNLVSLAVDYATALIQKQMYPSADQAANQAVIEMVEMCCAVNVRSIQGLSTFVTANVERSIRDLIARFDQIVMGISQMKQFGGGQQQQFGNPGYSGNMNTQRNWNSPISAPYNPGVGRPLVSPSLGSSGVFTNSATSDNNIGRGNGRFASSVSASDTLQQPFTPNKVAEMTPTQTTEQVAPKAAPKEWKPSFKYPYFPAYNPLEWDMHLVWVNAEPGERSSSVVFPHLTPKKEFEMDYNRHGVNTVFGAPPKALQVAYDAETVKLVTEGLKELSNLPAGEHLPKSPLIGALVEIKDVDIYETSLDALWFEGMLSRLSTPSGTVPHVFRMYGRVAEPFVSDEDENYFVAELAKTETFADLHEKLKDSAGIISVPLWSACNRKATALINRILKQNMSLPDISIDSFEADMIDLLKLIDKKYGATVLEWFVKHQRQQIKSTFQSLDDDDCRAQWADTYIDNRKFPEGEEPKFTYLASACSFTYLNCTIYELDIELNKSVGSAVHEKLTPIAHYLVKDLFKDIDDLRIRKQRHFDRHFIRTNDGTVLEACRGNVGDEWLILTLISNG